MADLLYLQTGRSCDADQIAAQNLVYDVMPALLELKQISSTVSSRKRCESIWGLQAKHVDFSRAQTVREFLAANRRIKALALEITSTIDAVRFVDPTPDLVHVLRVSMSGVIARSNAIASKAAVFGSLILSWPAWVLLAFDRFSPTIFETIDNFEVIDFVVQGRLNDLAAAGFGPKTSG